MNGKTNQKARSSPNGASSVGYARPPRQHQFKVGNKASRGRKAGSKNKALVIQQVLLEPVKVKEGEKVRKMPKLEAILRQTCNKALQGDYKAALTVIGLAQKEGLITAKQNDILEGNMSEDDKAILADFKKRLNDPEV